MDWSAITLGVEIIVHIGSFLHLLQHGICRQEDTYIPTIARLMENLKYSFIYRFWIFQIANADRLGVTIDTICILQKKK